ncbi:hypothetical protein F5B21DRAFT_126911 [Xylaria acuta]|nr:hypothetical protein F5B21DRAFT_126911 [Xylaria acuta]
MLQPRPVLLTLVLHFCSKYYGIHYFSCSTCNYPKARCLSQVIVPRSNYLDRPTTRSLAGYCGLIFGPHCQASSKVLDLLERQGNQWRTAKGLADLVQRQQVTAKHPAHPSLVRRQQVTAKLDS